jgi:hypothetical protein
MAKNLLTKFKSPTSISIFPDQSPQQNDEPNILNAFTTKNVMVRTSQGQQWNTVENNKLVYKRSARGAPIGSYPKILYGPRVEILTSTNYKKLKKGDQIYYDRGSVVFRGPFTYEKTLRGPNLLLTIGDLAYKKNIYKFIIPVSNLKKETLYFETGRTGKSAKTHRKTARKTARKTVRKTARKTARKAARKKTRKKAKTRKVYKRKRRKKSKN